MVLDGRWIIVTVALQLLVLFSIVFGVNASQSSQPQSVFADEFPTLGEIKEMAKLSLLVYKFHHEHNLTCDTVNDDEDEYKDVNCHWYFHDTELGTQLLIVSNDISQYIAIVFAGTDDLRTSLEDANIFTKPFGNNSTVTLPNDDVSDNITNYVRVHAGFNNAVFTHQIWEQVYHRTKVLLQQRNKYKLYTTGHSLGAANAILTATAIASIQDESSSFPPVRCINFGCPQVGNEYWKSYVNHVTSPLRQKLGIWRVVLAWDLVPRLPELFYHVGHTIQIDGKTDEVRVYYDHYGDSTRGYAGAPMGWYSKSYAWLPYAIYYHRVHKYVTKLNQFNCSSSWPQHFYPVDGTIYDDDIWDNPPDDWIQAEEEEDEEEGYSVHDYFWYEKIKRRFL